MPKESKIFTLFIAAPGDVSIEKEVIRDLAVEWNRNRGQFIDARVEVTDWLHVFPEFNDRPQAIINEQLFDKADLVVAIFWTKFGSPTGIANSGTEEEILRAKKQNKPLMLYFSDVAAQPSTVDYTELEKVNTFKKEHQHDGLYKSYNTVDSFKPMFRNDLAGMMHKIMQGDKPIEDNSKAEREARKQEEKDTTGVDYKPVKEIEKRIIENFPVYLAKLYGIVEPKSALPNGLKVSKANNNKEEIAMLKEKVIDWNKRILSYTNQLTQILNDIEEYSDDELKNDIIRNDLWTVSGAHKSMDAELWLYKKNYEAVEAYKIKETVRNIMTAIEVYNARIPVNVKNNTTSTPSSFGFDILSEKETLLSGIIGKGIRSEILHKLDPKHFALMTRRSIWGLFFLSSESSEFVVDQTKDGLWRTVHNWDYMYDYFNLYNYIVFQLMKDHFSKFKINLDSNYKYGYTNLFLVEIFHHHAKEIEEYRRYKYKGI